MYESKEQIQQRLNEIEKEKLRLERMERYSGEDRVVSSREAIKIVKEQPVTPSYLTGLGLDGITGGFKAGEVVVVASATGEGKTTLLQTFTYQFSKQKINCVWFSYEVVMEDLISRFGNNIPNFCIPLKTKGADIEWLEARIWEARAKFDTRVVLIDQLHFVLDMKTVGNGNTSIAIGNTMRELKRIALETGTIIFLATHLTKKETGAVPTLNDLRDSSFIGQEADFVLLLKREDDGLDNDGGINYTNQTTLRVAKNRRKGLIKTVKLVHSGGRFNVS